YDNLQKIEAQRNLPAGVTEVEINDWTKTREANEIGDSEKKLNSYSDLSELNQNISDEDVESIDGLYDARWNLREPSEGITGNKVLRTIVNTGTSTKLRYNIDQLYGYLKSDKPIEWSENSTVSWNLWTKVDTTKSAVEWRMLSGKFNISETQLKKIKSNQAEVLLGIPADNDYGFELIIPFNDIISVFLNKNPTSINYTNRATLKEEYYLNNKFISYRNTAVLDTCQQGEYHTVLSNHTDGYHVDTNTIDQNNLLDTNISDNLIAGENTIDILIGNIITKLNSSYGFSKVNIYIIESPKINISGQFYTYENQEIVYFDENYLPKKDQRVYLRIDVENKSENIALNNLDLAMKINSELPLEISRDSVLFNNQDITSNTRCYINEDFSNQYTISELKSLAPGQKISIMSDDIKYTITQKNCKDKYVYIESVAKLNYVRGNLTYIDTRKLEGSSSLAKENRISIPVSNAFACLNITCSVDAPSETSFMISISGSQDFANLLIKPGQTCTINDLSLGQYNISLIVPQDYQVVDTSTYSASIQNTVTLSATNYEKSVQIELEKKNNSYFYKNNQEKINLSFD
ncbi:MAG: hypothetical protein ACI3VR_07430, partial [Intestinibacter sp.]|uniref:hypothetical protein n=1 Tax=Intestinibacter sp. TaxID=1965304 RepID=UPI003F1364A7